MPYSKAQKIRKIFEKYKLELRKTNYLDRENNNQEETLRDNFAIDAKNTSNDFPLVRASVTPGSF